MTEQYGYAGKILRVDLTADRITEIPSSDYLPEYVGGRGLAAKIYWDEIMPEVGALSPENRLILAAGALTGTGAALAAPSICVAKSPMIYPKSTIYISSATGGWSHEMKYAGYDAIIVQGKAENPVYIWIEDGHVEIRNAHSLWGRTTRQTRAELIRKHGGRIQVACIGPAGENLVIPSIISLDSNTAYGLGGFGAVMGSKNLKAIAIRGTGRIKVANPRGVMEVTEHLRSLYSLKHEETRVLDGGETMVGTRLPQSIFDLTSMYFPKSKLDNEKKLGLLKKKQRGCPGCFRMCKSKIEFEDNAVLAGSAECGEVLHWVSPEQKYYGGLMWGRVAWEASMLNDELGLDDFNTSCAFHAVSFSEKSTMEASMALDIWLEAYKRGIFTEENTGLPWSEFGSREFLRQWLNMLAYREGFGDVLARGSYLATKYILEHEEFGPRRGEMAFLYRKCHPKAGLFGGVNRHVLYPRSHPVGAFYSAVSTKRGKEVHGVAGNQPNEFLIKYFGTDKIKDPSYWGEDVAKATIANEHYNMEVDSATSCAIISPIQFWVEYNTLNERIKNSVHGIPEYWSAVFGGHTTQDDLNKKYEMLVNLERAIWVRDGYLEGKVDTYEDCIFEEEDSKGNKMVPRDKFESLLPVYYRMRGWKNGVPTRAKLEELGLKYVADELQERGLAAIQEIR